MFLILSIEDRCYLLPYPFGNKNRGDSKLLHFIHVSMKHEDFLLHITTHQHHQSSESTQQLFDANDDNSVLTPRCSQLQKNFCWVRKFLCFLLETFAGKNYLCSDWLSIEWLASFSFLFLPPLADQMTPHLASL